MQSEQPYLIAAHGTFIRIINELINTCIKGAYFFYLLKQQLSDRIYLFLKCTLIIFYNLTNIIIHYNKNKN